MERAAGLAVLSGPLKNEKAPEGYEVERKLEEATRVWVMDTSMRSWAIEWQ